MHTNLLTGHVPAYIKRQFSLLITLTYLFSQTNPVCTGFIPQQNTVRSKHGHVNSCGDSECCCPLSNVQYVKVCPPQGYEYMVVHLVSAGADQDAPGVISIYISTAGFHRSGQVYFDSDFIS